MTVRTRISSFARANAICCQFASAISFLASLGLIIGGAVLIDKNVQFIENWSEPCSGGIRTEFRIDDHRGYRVWQQHCQEYEDSQRDFAIGVSMVFLGCVLLIAGSLMMCCACGFAAVSTTSKEVITITQTTLEPTNQMPMGSYTNQPMPPAQYQQTAAMPSISQASFSTNQIQQPYPFGAPYPGPSMPPPQPPPAYQDLEKNQDSQLYAGEN